MTDNEIIKADEWIIANYENYIKDGCNNIEKELLDLAKRQKAEIERLIGDVTTYKVRWAKAEASKETAKSEAIKELLNVLELRVVCKQKTTAMGYESAIIDIKNLLKEMVGDDNA